MRILLVHNRYQNQGGEDLVFAAEKALLLQKGHEVHEFIADNRQIQGLNRLTAAVQAVFSISSYRKMNNLINEFRPEIVHFHNTFMIISPSAYYACSKLGVPVVQTLHNYRILCPAATFIRSGKICEVCLGEKIPWPAILHGCWRNSRLQTLIVAMIIFINRILKTWSKKVDCYIALTEFSQEKFANIIPADKLSVKPNFCDNNIIQTCLDTAMQNQNAYALFMGRLVPEKGVIGLLRVFQKMSSVPLRIIGDGPLYELVASSILNTPAQNIQIRRWIDHSEALIQVRGASFLLFPSEWYEGFPLTIAEAFACGVPVIASHLGAMAEIIEDGKTGLLFKPGDIEEIGAKVDWAWNHPQEMAEMGRAARREYEEKYTSERNYRLLMEIYQKAIENRRNRQNIHSK